MNTQTIPAEGAVERHHAAFLSILPKITRHGRVSFRHLRCRDKRDDCIAEMVALSFQWYLRLIERGKDPTQFPTALATYAARAVRSGRRLCGQEKGGDVLSPLAQVRHSFNTQTIPEYDTSTADNTTLDALRDNTATPPPDQAHFRVEFPRWVKTYADRERRLIHDMMQGERTHTLAEKYGLSPGRISQRRRDFMVDWNHFCDEPV